MDSNSPEDSAIKAMSQTSDPSLMDVEVGLNVDKEQPTYGNAWRICIDILCYVCLACDHRNFMYFVGWRKSFLFVMHQFM